MKKIICFVLIILTVFSCLVPSTVLKTAAEGLAMPSQLNGINNIMLMYTFNQQGAVSGRHTVETLLPYVGYYDTSGQLKDIFFDAFLLLPCVSTGPSGGTMYISDNPAVASDWQAFRDDIFADGYNLDALNTAVGQVKKQLGKSDYKAKVFFTVSYPNDGQTDFGSIGGRTYNFSILQDRIDYCKWQIDDYISRFNSGKYENLEVVGFYWFEEFIKQNDSTEKTLLTSTTSYIRQKGYKSIWIPYYMASGWNKWKEYGFDVACLQPNYMFNYNAANTRVKEAVENAKKYDMCNEVEISGSVFTSAEYYNRYLTYLRDFTAYGAIDAIKMYYQDVKFYYECYRSEMPEKRVLYDLTYKYAKGTLKESDLEDKYLESSGVSQKYDIVSYGCSYTATKPYTDTTLEYANVDGKELTDGRYAMTNYGTEWHAFYRPYADRDGKLNITLDLGSYYDNLEYIYLEFRDDAKASIGVPAKVDFYVSSDGVNFSPLKTVAPAGPVIGEVAARYEDGTFGARYIKAVFPYHPDRVFVFASEIAVGASKFDKSLGEGYDIISKGCPYTAFEPYTNTAEWNAPYMQIDGKELTDGILGSSPHGTEWHDMHASALKEGEKFFVNIDLGSVRNNISYIGMQFGNDPSSGIAKPGNVTYYLSEDGVNYTQAGTVAVRLGTDGYGYGVLISADPLSARYVKAEFASGKSVHNFVSEMSVGVNKKTQGEYTLGDVNLSGSIEIADYLSAKRIAAGNLNATDTALSAADIDCDGKITESDCIKIKQLFLKSRGF